MLPLSVLVFSLRLLALAPIQFVYASPTTKRDTTPITAGSTVDGKTYDYIICGGGLSGSVLASRLTEDPTRTVLLIEAGYSQEDNSGDASKYQSTFNTPVDWAFKTVPQSSADNRTQTMRSGKALGGSTTINGMAWSKPHTYQIDALETVGNVGLNWATLQPYMLKAENGIPPSVGQAADGLTYLPSCHGTGGPVDVQFDPSAMPTNLERAFNSTAGNLGLPYAYDLSCGNPVGRSPIANTRIGGTRMDAYRAYLYQKSRPNLTILTGALVGKVSLSAAKKATGVQFVDASNNVYTASARLEVILTAGSLKTPAILQYSGIGPASILSAAGVQQIVDLPVGLNLIDQTTSTTDFNFNGARGGGQSIAFPSFTSIFQGSEATQARSMLSDASLTTYAQQAVDAGAHSNAAGLKSLLSIQADWILSKGAGISESFDYSYGNTFGYDSWYLLPFGRGSVRIADSLPYSGNIEIDPRYFSNAFDTYAQGATVKFTKSLSINSPLSNFVTGHGGSLPQSPSSSVFATWAKTNYRSNWHPIGTVSMMTQDKGGCLNSDHQLYGVTGLRVVDASVLPFQVSSHLMSVLYGLAERAADIIKTANAGIGPATTTTAQG